MMNHKSYYTEPHLLTKLKTGSGWGTRNLSHNCFNIHTQKNLTKRLSSTKMFSQLIVQSDNSQAEQRLLPNSAHCGYYQRYSA